jgi:phage repressor protein C with HTH and peptisase S24 domain
MKMFINRLDEFLVRRLGSKATSKEKAELCGLNYEFFRQIMNQTRNPPADDNIVKMSKKMKLLESETAELLLLAAKDRAKEPETKGILSKLLGETAAAIDDFEKNTTIGQIAAMRNGPNNVVALPAEDHTIPIYTSIKAGNGEMGITDGETDGEITITDDYLKQKVFAVKVSGDSMADELYDGEIALFKPINGEPTRDRDIYAVEVEGWSSWVVKFVRHDPSGMVQLISANSAYPVKEINPKVSRVILRGRLIESRRIRK